MDGSDAAGHQMPLWVKVTIIAAIVVALAVVLLLAFGGGPGAHGPGRHA